MDESTFLAKVRRCQARSRLPAVPAPAANRPIQRTSGPQQRIERFVGELKQLGAHVERAAGWAEARERASEILARWQPRCVVCWNAPMLDALDLAGATRQWGGTVVSDAQLGEMDEPARRAVVLSADVGVTSADWGIAETGSLLLSASPDRSRSASLLPPRHLVVLEEDQIVDDLFDVFEGGGGDALRSVNYAVFVTGPSKTGDIALQLTTGVHGPGELSVMVVRQR